LKPTSAAARAVQTKCAGESQQKPGSELGRIIQEVTPKINGWEVARGQCRNGRASVALDSAPLPGFNSLSNAAVGLAHATKPFTTGKRREATRFPSSPKVPRNRIGNPRSFGTISRHLSLGAFSHYLLYSEANPGGLGPKERSQHLLTQAVRDSETTENLGQKWGVGRLPV
jgi:hypothetical protein